jgi:hypothetical protein
LPIATPFNEYVTLRDVAPLVGSYYSAYSLAVAGLFGEPVAVYGRTRLFARAKVEFAITQYLARRARRAHRSA